MKKLAFIAVFFTIISCTDGLDRLPETDNVLPRDKMVEVIRDMIKLESHIQLKYKNVGEYYKVMINSGDSLLKTKGVTRQQYEESMDYYGSRQSEMQLIYSDVLDQLNKEMGELQSSKESNK